MPQTRVRMSILPGEKTGSEILYDKLFEKNLFANFSDIYTFFETNFATSSTFSRDAWQREDHAYPLQALREGILNALVHRDYSNPSGSAMIAFYPDRLEISNYGLLPETLKPSDLKKNHLSHPRNPDIAHICFLRGWIEKIGRGTLMILQECKTKGFPEAKWQSRSGITTLTFPGITVASLRNGVDKGVFDGIINGVNDAINNGVIDGIIDGVSDGVSDGLIEVIKTLTQKEGIKAVEIANEIGRSKPTIERYLKILKTLNIVTFVGSPKIGGYVICKSFKEKI